MDYTVSGPERFDPMDPAYEDIVVIHMFERYELAASFYGGSGSIVDAGCGLGYGTAQLAKSTGATVVGVDSSQDALDVATERHEDSGCEFRRGDLTAEIPPASLIVAIDFIEHLVDPEAFVRTAKNVSTGRVFIGWPLFAMTPPRKSARRNLFHVSEPNREDVCGWFADWKMVCDQWEEGSRERYRFLCFERKA